jgi:signal transduction histidine kinase/ActR/RegA family two-component response regulator
MKIVSKLILVVLFLTYHFAGYANPSVDSLQKILNSNADNITKVDANYSLAKIHAKSESPEMNKYLFESLQLAREIGYNVGIAKANLLFVDTHQGLLNNDTLIQLLKEAELIFAEALMQLEKAKTLNHLGILYERQGKYRLAINCYYKALFVFQSLNDETGIANEKNNIGLIHQLQKQYKNAIFYFQEAIQIGKKINDLDVLANAYNNMGICYQEMAMPSVALGYFEKVYDIDKQQNIPQNLALSYNNLGVIQTDLANYAKAKYYLFKSLSLKNNSDDYTGLSNTFNNIATVYLQTNNFDSAKYFVHLAIKEAKAEMAYPILKESYIIHSKLSEKQSLLSEALYYQKLGNQLADSLNGAENTILLAQMEDDYNNLFDEKSKVEYESEKEKSKLKTGLFILLSILAVILILFMVYYILKVKTAYKNLQVKQKKIEVQNKILQVKNIEVLQAKEAAEEAANVKSQFISTISHEIRTPLNAIIGVANLLNTGKSYPDQFENLNILKISSENLLQLVNNILDFSKMEAGKLQLENIDFNLKSLIYDVKDLFSIKAMEKGVELLVGYDEKIPSVLKGDPLRINQLLINLVNNGIKFTESGYVKIEVTVQLSTINNVLLHFSVSDTGIGIPTNKQAEIFHSFTQADSNTTRKYGGTGLGLSICKRILENLHSKLMLDSIVGKGSKFYFNINFEVSRSASVGKSARTASFENSIQGKRVLVVEDNMMNIMVLRQFLQKWGVITEIALNGKEGVSRLMESNFDAILMDIHMPEMDGIEATIIIRKLADEKKRNVPIIALTAENEMQFRQKVYEVGMNDYIFKPFNPDDLKERLGYALYNNQSIAKPSVKN